MYDGNSCRAVQKRQSAEGYPSITCTPAGVFAWTGIRRSNVTRFLILPSAAGRKNLASKVLGLAI